MGNKLSILFRYAFFVLFCLLIFTNPVSGQSKEFKKKLKEADKAWNAGDIVKSKKIYENCYRLQPQNIDCLKGLVEVYYSDQNYNKTYEYLTEYIAVLETQIAILENKSKLSGKENKGLNRYKALLADAQSQLYTVKSNVAIEEPKPEEVVRNEPLPVKEIDKDESLLNPGNEENNTEKNIIEQPTNTDLGAPIAAEAGNDQGKLERNGSAISKSQHIYINGAPEKIILDDTFKDLEPDLYFAGSSVISVKSQFVDDVTSKTNGSIKAFNYASVQNKLNELQSLIKQQQNEKRKQNKVLGDSLLLLTHKRNQFQIELNQIEMEISGLNTEKEKNDKIKTILTNKKNYYTQKRDAVKGENRTVRYYNNTLLLIQKLSNSGNASIAKSIKVLNNSYNEFKGLAPYTVMQFRALYDNKDMRAFTIIDGYLTKEKVVGNTFIPGSEEIVYKFLSNDRLLCLNDSGLYHVGSNSPFGFNQSAIEYINSIKIGTGEEELDKNILEYNFLYSQIQNIVELENQKDIDAKLASLMAEKDILNSNINGITSTLSTIKQKLKGQTLYIPVFISSVNNASVNDFYTNLSSEIFDIAYEQAVEFESVDKVVQFTQNTTSNLTFYWNELISLDKKLILNGYKLLGWGQIENDDKFYLNCLFEFRVNHNIEISTASPTKGVSGSNQKPIEHTSFDNPIEKPLPNLVGSTGEFKKVKENKVDVLLIENLKFKFLDYLSFSDFLTVKTEEDIAGWILPDTEKLKVFFDNLGTSNGIKELEKLGANKDNLRFLTKSRRIDSRTQEFVVEVIQLTNSGVEIVEIADNESVNIVLVNKYEN